MMNLYLSVAKFVVCLLRVLNYFVVQRCVFVANK